MDYICALIAVKDINSARLFYEEVLGQQVKYDFGEKITLYGDFFMHLQSHYEEFIGKKISSDCNNFELYFEEDDLEKIVSDLKKKNVKFVHELKEQPWRQKAIRFYDPDRNIIEIGESLEHLSFRLNSEGLSVEEISSTVPYAC